MRFLRGDPSVAGATYALAQMLREQRELVEAEALFRESVAMREALNGTGHPLTAEALDGLTSMLVNSSDSSRNEEIKVLWARTVESFEEAYGARSPKDCSPDV